MLERRSFITGLISLVAAPAIVRAGSLMPVKAMVGLEDWGSSVDWRDLIDAQRQINLRRSLTIKYLKDNLFKPYDTLVDGLLTNQRFVEAIDAQGGT